MLKVTLRIGNYNISVQDENALLLCKNLTGHIYCQQVFSVLELLYKKVKRSYCSVNITVIGHLLIYVHN